MGRQDALRHERRPMKIALIIENSQAAKSAIIADALKAVAEPFGHEVHHYGMYTPEDSASLTYVMTKSAAARGWDRCWPAMPCRACSAAW